MKISIFGLGYVGFINIGCLAESGYDTIGVDVNESRVNLINHGEPPIAESDIDVILKKRHNA